MRTKLLLFAVLTSPLIWAQVSLSDGNPQIQNFDSMGAALALPVNWRIAPSTLSPTWISSQTAVTKQASSGSSGTGGTYNWGSTATERAIGAMSSSNFASPSSVIGYFKNLNINSEVLIQLDISYNLERYRINTAPASVQFYYSIDGSSWVGVPAGDIEDALLPIESSLFNFPPGLIIHKSFVLSGLNIAFDKELYLRWNLNTTGANSQGIGIDDISVSATFTTNCSSPTNQASAISVANITTSTADFSWLNAVSASGTLVVINPFSAPASMPASGSNYTANSNWTFAGQIDVSNRVVYKGSGSSISGISGLAQGTEFTASIYSFNNPGSCYNISKPEQLNFTTLSNGNEINVRGLVGTNPSISNGSNSPMGTNNTLFAATNIGKSQTKNFRIENTGSSPLTISSVSFDGAHSTDFAFTGFASFPFTIASGSSIDFSIIFKPTDTGIRTGTISIVNNDSNENPYTFRIQGTGAGPEIEISGRGIAIHSGSLIASPNNNTDFGNINTDTASSTKIFSIYNIGTATLHLSKLTLTGTGAADFSISYNFPDSLAAHSSRQLIFVFKPTSIGLKTATVTITNDDPNENPYTFTISGNSINYKVCALGAIETIAIQDFENSATLSVLKYEVLQNPGAGPFIIGGGQARGSSRAIDSNMFNGASSFQLAGHLASSGTELATTLLFDTLDASAFQEVSLYFKTGAYATTNSQGLDGGTEKISVLVSIDDGTNWSEELSISGNSNSIWDINSATGTAIFDYDGNNILEAFTSGPNTVNTGPRAIQINNLPNSSKLRIKIILALDLAVEKWVIDDFELLGRKPLISIWSAGTWTPKVPTAITKVKLETNYDTGVGGNIEACECVINSGTTLEISSGKYVEIQSDLINNGTLNIANSGSLVQVNDAALNAGMINMKRDVKIRKLDYVYWTSPVLDFPVTRVSTNTSAGHIWKWLPTQNGKYGIWNNTQENMIKGKGYIIRGPNDYDNSVPQNFTANFLGAPNNGIIQTSIERGAYDDQDYTNPSNGITVSKEDDNWNLVGNPYPSAINALDFLKQNTNIQGKIYLWTHGTLPNNNESDPFYGNYSYNYSSNDYVTFNGTGANGGPSAFKGYIAAAQSFFVVMNNGPAGSSQSVQFTNSMRSRDYSNNQFYRTTVSNSKENKEMERHRIWLDLIAKNGQVSRMLIGYVEGATYSKDRLFDAEIQLGNGQNIYSLIGEDEVNIQGRPIPFDSDDVISLGVQLDLEDSYTIAIAAMDGLFKDNSQTVYLEDMQEHQIHDLTAAPYVFSSNKGLFDKRFLLRYKKEALSIVSSDKQMNKVLVSIRNSKIHVQSLEEEIIGITLYDFLGRKLFTTNNINELEYDVDYSAQNHQIVVAQIYLKNNQMLIRKIIF